jgi:hypothetical protein
MPAGHTYRKMNRSIFSLGFSTDPWKGAQAGIPVYNVNRDTIDKDRGAFLKKLPIPPGMTQSYPYIVKIAGEGEYVVSANGMAQFYSYKYGRWEPPQSIENGSMWGKMFQVE